MVRDQVSLLSPPLRDVPSHVERAVSFLCAALGIADREVAFFLAKCLVCKCNCIGDALSGAFFFLLFFWLNVYCVISPSLHRVSRVLWRENLSRNLIEIVSGTTLFSNFRTHEFLFAFMINLSNDYKEREILLTFFTEIFVSGNEGMRERFRRSVNIFIIFIFFWKKKNKIIKNERFIQVYVERVF